MRARLWPMGVPYPEVELDDAPTMASRRRQQRWATTRMRRQVVNMMVAAYSFLSLGSPATAAAADTARCRLTGLQWKVVDLMEERIRYVSRAAGRVSGTVIWEIHMEREEPAAARLCRLPASVSRSRRRPALWTFVTLSRRWSPGV